jgi:hypothetical protein
MKRHVLPRSFPAVGAALERHAKRTDAIASEADATVAYLAGMGVVLTEAQRALLESSLADAHLRRAVA